MNDFSYDYDIYLKLIISTALDLSDCSSVEAYLFDSVLEIDQIAHAVVVGYHCHV